MIQIYKKKNTDFSKNGDSPIFPSSAVVNAELNGAWTLELVLQPGDNIITFSSGFTVSIVPRWRILL